MAKALFRFLRGELNGFYLTNINAMMNRLTEDDKKFFIDFARIQFEEGKIDSETLYNLGRFAGIYLPRIPQSEARSDVRMTESEYNEQLDYQFSERGLLKPEDETFEFEQEVIDDTGLPDINTLATETKRSSLVGDEPAQGYISEEETGVRDDDGNVKPDKILPSPPQDVAYSDFNGNQFCFLSEAEVAMLPVSYGVFLELFKAIQYVRYNGGTISSLARIVEILCPQGLVTIDSIEVAGNKKQFIVSYSTDLDVEINLKQDRINVLLYIIDMKFPLVRMTENL